MPGMSNTGGVELPTPADIFVGTALIRLGWSEDTRRGRRCPRGTHGYAAYCRSGVDDSAYVDDDGWIDNECWAYSHCNAKRWKPMAKRRM